MSTDYLPGPPLKLIFLIKNNNSVNKRKKHLNIWFPLVLLSNFLSQWYWYSQQLPRISIILKLTSGSWYYIFFLYCWIVHSEQIVYSICFLFVQIQNVVKIWKLKKNCSLFLIIRLKTFQCLKYNLLQSLSTSKIENHYKQIFTLMLKLEIYIITFTWVNLLIKPYLYILSCVFLISLYNVIVNHKY